MKRGLVISLALLLSIGLALSGFGYWCTGTTSGARWLIDSADNFTGIEVKTAELEGSLLDGLSLKELRVAWEGGGIQAADLKLAVRRFNPFSGQLAIEELTINRLVLQLDESPEEPATANDDGPGAEALLAVAPNWLSLEIDRLYISAFTSRSTAEPTDEAVIATLISGHYLLANQRLVAQDFSYHSPYVELDGEFDWQLALPRLVMTADIFLPRTCVDPALLESIVVPARFPGYLELDGDWNRYTGPVRFGVIDEAGDKVWLSARATGSWRGVHFEDLKGRYLGGAIAGDLDLSWIDSYRMGGQLAVHELDPSALIEGTTGKTSFDVSGELIIPYDDQPLQADFSTVIREARFRGHVLQGRAAGRFLGHELVNLDVDLTGDGAHLLARGIPAQRVDVDLEVADLTMYHEDLSGKIAAKGWLSWSENSLSGEIDGYGEELGWKDIRVRTVSLQARHRTGEEPVALTLNGEDWYYGDLRFDRVTGELSGTLTDHQVEVATETSFGHFTALAHGKYQPGTWTGRLEKLVGDKTPLGRWSMPEPTEVAWNEGILKVEKLPLVADEGSRLELEVDSWGSPDRAVATLNWSGFKLDWLQPYVDLDSLTGSSDGQIEYTIIAGRPQSISGRASARGRIMDENYDLTYEKLELDFDWGQDGLQMTGVSQSDAGEEIQVSATATGPLVWKWPVDGLGAELQWQGLNLSRFSRFLEETQAEGVGDGSLSFAFAGEQLERIQGHLAAKGRLMQGERELGPRSLLLDLNWDDKNFQSTAKVEGARGGNAVLKLSSTQQPTLAWPESGQIELKVNNLSLGAIEPLLPQDIDITGTIDSLAEGRWEQTDVVNLTGRLQLKESRISWNSDSGQVLLPLRDASSEWRWVDESFNGTFALDLSDHGNIRGSWQLPLPARIPTAFEPDGPLQVNVEAKMQAIGILSAIGPWLVQDLRGETSANLALQGTWEKPDLRGEILFKDGAAYLPAAGVQLEDIELRSELTGDRLRVDRLSLRSGSGDLAGQGEIIFDQWRLASYHFDIAGEDFQVVDFPEVQMTCSPELLLTGTPDRLALQGSALIPKLAIRGIKDSSGVQPSKDVIVVKEEEERQELEFATDIHVVVELGEDVTVKSDGVDTRLTGGAILTMGPTGELLARGEVSLVSGSFRAHGVNLDIRQGLLSYQGGVITNPDLRIFAAREVGEVLAGVQVTGNAEAPVVTLYSRPTMPERDILGYMLMGRAISTESQETDMLMMGAGSLLPSYGGGLSELGITEIDIQGLFTGTGGLRLRRKLAEKWEIESNLGVESGIDLYYIIELE